MGTIKAVEGDTRVESFTLKLAGVAVDLTGATVVCHQRNDDTGTVVTSHTVNVAADPTTGVIAVTFTPTELVPGRHTLEFEVDDARTYPDDADDRPVLIVRPENG